MKTIAALPSRLVRMKFLSPDSGFMRGLSDAVDAIWINILMLVTSIPVITITTRHDARSPAKARSPAITSPHSDQTSQKQPDIG